MWQLDYQHAQGRTPLCATLAGYLGISAAAVGLVEGPHGRPSLDQRHDQTLQFNWSHSGEHAIIAIARGLTPGIDVERRRPRTRALELAQRFFSDSEAAALAALPSDQRSAAFLELWTAKEAVLKALGRGIAFGLHRLEVSRTQGQLQLQRLDGEDATAWQLQALSLNTELIAALAWRGGARHIRLGTLASAG
ncbi:MAG: 4'-phosphopantetheinyl transferase family protein [Rhodanobacter sp.]